MAELRTNNKVANANKIYYKGFSSRNASKPGGSFSITNIDCVNEDLLNHIYTTYYSRPHMPSFGTRIPNLAFEPNDQDTQSIIQEDLTKVFNYDPRVKLQSLNIYSLPDQYAIVAIANLLYVELNITGDLNIQIYTT